jgi:hypothetical protein
VEGNVTRECSKDSGRNKGDGRKKGKNPSNQKYIIGPSSPKSVSKLDKGKKIVLEKPHVSKVK